MKRLIVNADDYGYSEGINRGIVEAHQRGIVTSTSVMVDAPFAQKASELVGLADLSIGLHFVPSGTGEQQIELVRQAEKFISIIGRRPDHIDTHKRKTAESGIKEALLAYAKEHEIPVRGLGYAKLIDAFIGIHSSDHVTVQSLKAAIDDATEPYNEIMCHVGYSDDYLRANSSYNDLREEELRTICNPEIRRYLEEKDIELVNWKELG